jgi:hypothetical protein
LLGQGILCYQKDHIRQLFLTKFHKNLLQKESSKQNKIDSSS